MKTISAYELKDGVRFFDKKTALLYELLLERCEEIEENFFLNPKVRPKGNYSIQQDRDKINCAWNIFVERVLKSYVVGFDKQIEGTLDYFIGKHKNHIENISRIVLECCDEFPCIKNLYYRFTIISAKTFIEYEQPYFVIHEEQFSGEKIVM